MPVSQIEISYLQYMGMGLLLHLSQILLHQEAPSCDDFPPEAFPPASTRLGKHLRGQLRCGPNGATLDDGHHLEPPT